MVTRPAAQDGDLLLAQIAAEPGELCGAAGYFRDLGAGLGELGRGVDPDHSPRPVLRGEPSDHARLGRAGHRADKDRVEEDPKLALLLLHLIRPVRKAQATQPVVRGARRDRIRDTPLRAHLRQSLLPAGLDTDTEPGAHEA